MDKLKELMKKQTDESLVDYKQDAIVDLGTGSFVRGIISTVMKELYALWLIPLIIIILFLILHTVELVGLIQLLQGKNTVLKNLVT
uniref:Uncharacterized protein n=1 Tax=viral metagenome TaxID=1070528 RepID=A0A6C0KD09_9ZZZZ